MTYVVQDLCMGLTYSDPILEYPENNRTKNKNSTLFDVVQLVLQPRLPVYLKYLMYNPFKPNVGQVCSDVNCQSMCGDIKYTGYYTGNYSVIHWGIDEKYQNPLINEIDLMYQPSGVAFSVYAPYSYMKGHYQVTYTA